MDDEYLNWRAWRARRELELLEPHGWLSLTSLTWLGAEPTPLPDFPGRWSARGEGRSWVVTVAIDEGDAVDRDGLPLGSTVVAFPLADGAGDATLSHGDIVAEVAQRGHGVIVRVRNPRAATRLGFRGVPAFDVDLDWVRPARFTPADGPREIEVPSAQEGLGTRIVEVGRALVTLPDDTTVDLEVTDLHGDLVVIFHDATNGVETSAWRRAPLVAERDGWVVDFNLAQNFPAHFTPFGTCPAPPDGQTVPLAVRAGEKIPAEPAR